MPFTGNCMHLSYDHCVFANERAEFSKQLDSFWAHAAVKHAAHPASFKASHREAYRRLGGADAAAGFVDVVLGAKVRLPVRLAAQRPPSDGRSYQPTAHPS
jgi:hypothetical protein